jgi:hypothetical protein
MTSTTSIALGAGGQPKEKSYTGFVFALYFIGFFDVRAKRAICTTFISTLLVKWLSFKTA